MDTGRTIIADGSMYPHIGRILSISCIVFTAIVIGALLPACSDDENAPLVPPSGPVDSRLVGDWAFCNDDWSYGYSGTRIGADGLITWLGIDWSTGKSCVLTYSPYNVYAEIETRDNLLVYKQVDRAYDTLTWTLNGDRLEWLLSGLLPYRKLRRIEPGQQLATATSMQFSATVSGIPFELKTQAPMFPVFASMEQCGTVQDLSIGCMQDWSFTFVVHDYTGPGSYPLTIQGVSWGRVNQIDGDMIWAGQTDSTHTGTITITSFDQTLKRCTGTFEFDAAASGTPDVMEVRNGSFDIPITR